MGTHLPIGQRRNMGPCRRPWNQRAQMQPGKRPPALPIRSSESKGRAGALGVKRNGGSRAISGTCG